MKLRRLKSFLLMITLLITLISCYQYQVKLVKAQATIDSISIQTISNLTNPNLKAVSNNSDNLSMVVSPQDLPTKRDIIPAAPKSNDYDLEVDPQYNHERTLTDASGKTVTVPKGYIAHVYNAKQFLHAVYGNYYSGRTGNTGRDRIPYQNAQSNQMGFDTDITKIVLEKDIDISKEDQDPDIYVKDPKTNEVIQDDAHKVVYSNENLFTGSGATNPDSCGDIWLTTRRTPSWEVDQIDVGKDNKGNTITKTKDFSVLTIDGAYTDSSTRVVKNHNINLGRFSIETWNDIAPRWNQKIIVQNLNIYGNSYYGIVRAESTANNTQEIYKNVNYYGGQFLYSIAGSSVSIITEGTINAYSLKTYIYDKRTFYCQGTSDINGNDHNLWGQQNMQAYNLTFKGTYNGYTYNGNVLELTGSAIFENGSRVTLYPHGSSTETNLPTIGRMACGFAMTGTNNPLIDLQGDAQLKIICNTNDAKDAGIPAGITTDKVQTTDAAGAICMGGTGSELRFEGKEDTTGNKVYPQLNVESYGKIYNNNPLVNLNTGLANLSHGDFHITANNLGDYYNELTNLHASGGLMTIGGGMKIRVKTGGDFSVKIGPGKTADKATNLLYSKGDLDLVIDSPKSVVLDNTLDPCKRSALVYIDRLRTISDIKAYNIRVSAKGNSEFITGKNVAPHHRGPGGSGLGAADGSKTDVSIGMTSNDPPLKVEALVLPFAMSAINATEYLNDNRNIQAPKIPNLEALKAAMNTMQGKEFNYIKLSDSPAPVLEKADKQGNVLYTKDLLPATKKDKSPTDETKVYKRFIASTVSGNEWIDENEANTADNIPFWPAQPRVQVLLKRPKVTKPDPNKPSDYQFIDLGSKVNKEYQAERKFDDTDPLAASPSKTATWTVPVTPNTVDETGSIFDNDQVVKEDLLGVKTNPLDSHTDLQPGDPDYDIWNKQMHPDGGNKPALPKYLDPKDVKWIESSKAVDPGDLNNSIDSSKPDDPSNSTWEPTTEKRYQFIYDFQKVLDDYNDKQTQDNKVYPTSRDQIVTRVVTNFQQTFDQLTRLHNLMLELSKPKSYYLLGEHVNLPLKHTESDPDAKKLDLTGEIILPDGKTNIPVTNSIALDSKNMNTAVKSNWDLGEDATTQAGEHTVSFTGQDDKDNPAEYYDDQGNISTDFEWKYKVLPFPSYTGVQLVGANDAPVDNDKPIPNGIQTVITTFTPPAPQYQAELNKIFITKKPNTNDEASANVSIIKRGMTITVKYTDDKNKEHTATIPFHFEEEYTPKDFKLGALSAFPKNSIFVIKYKANFTGNQLVQAHLMPDQLHVNPESSKYSDDILLSESNSNSFQIQGYMVLSTPSLIDFGLEILTSPLKSQQIYPKNIEGNLSVQNHTDYKQKVTLTGEIETYNSVQGDNPLRFLKYKFKDSTMKDLNNPVTIFSDHEINGKDKRNNIYNVSSTWSRDQIGPILDIPMNTSAELKQYKAVMTWQIVLGP